MEIIISNYDSLSNPYYAGGGAHAMHELGKRLAVRHGVTVVCGAHKGCKDEVIDGVRYVHIGPKGAGPALGQAIFSVLLPFTAMRKTFDVWLENFIPPHSTNFIPLATRKPVIGITSIINAAKFSQKYHLPFFLIENTGLRVYKHFIALSEDIKKRILAKNPGANVRIIPDGIDERYLTMETHERPYIFFMGRLDVYQKGLDLLLKAWKNVSYVHPGITLVLAGSGTKTDESRLHGMIREMGLEKSVVLEGKVSGEKKDELMKNCLFAVAPSRFESFGIAALEMLALGKPLVCFDIDGFHWIPPTICYKVPQYNAKEFSDAMVKLITDKEMRISLSDSARSFASGYNWDRIALEYEDLIQDVVGVTL